MDSTAKPRSVARSTNSRELRHHRHVLGRARPLRCSSGISLVVGIEDDQFFLASDVPAFLEYTDTVVYLEDGDVAIVDEDGIECTDLAGEPITREPETVEWDPEQAGKGEYDHFMLKEIHEQPVSLSQAIEGRVDPARGRIALEFGPATFEESSPSS